MENVFAFQQTSSSNLVNRLLENLGGTLGTITDDNFPTSGEMHNVPEWMHSAKTHERGSVYTATSASGTAISFNYITQESTGIVFYDFEFKQLAAAAEEQNERRFCDIADEITWDSRSPEYLILAIRLGLAAGAYIKALNLTQIGSKLHPNNAEIQKFARILAPATVKKNNLPPQPEGQRNIQGLKEIR